MPKKTNNLILFVNNMQEYWLELTLLLNHETKINGAEQSTNIHKQGFWKPLRKIWKIIKLINILSPLDPEEKSIVWEKTFFKKSGLNVFCLRKTVQSSQHSKSHGRL